MSESGLIAIRKRIKSINNTKKITKAVGVVATSKLKKIKHILEFNNSFNEYENNIVNNIILKLKNEEKYYKYLKNNECKKKLYVIFTSDMGLCGGFNINVIQELISKIANNKEENLFIVVGKKGRIILKKLGYECISEYVEIPKIPTLKEAKTISNRIIQLYEEKQVGEVFVVYTKFTSSMKQVINIKKILPLQYENDNLNKENKNYIEYECDCEMYLKYILNGYLKHKILNIMLNSKTCEEVIRMNAMDSATRNANDLLKELSLKYNRIRQSAITQEISEIVGGAEAQK